MFWIYAEHRVDNVEMLFAVPGQGLHRAKILFGFCTAILVGNETRSVLEAEGIQPGQVTPGDQRDIPDNTQ